MFTATAPPSAQSWFQQVRSLCVQYLLPHPLNLLENPPSKQAMKRLVKLKVSEFWHHKLSNECLALQSLKHFNPSKCSLQSPHPMWTASAHSIYETNKTKVLARMVSGRYRTEKLCRYWSNNRAGHCLAVGCHEIEEDLEHLLICCPALQPVRKRLHDMWLNKSACLPELQSLIRKILSSPPDQQVKFILDSTSNPVVISLHQAHGQPLLNLVLYMTRTFAYCIHREKMILTRRWPELNLYCT